MALQKGNPFYTELGNILNLVRSISLELTEEEKNNKTGKTELNNIWYARDLSFARLQANLLKLESEIEYFFTENGCRKAIDKTFNTQIIRQKFLQAFKTLSNEYFSIKTNETEKNTEQQHDTIAGKTSKINNNKDMPFSLLN